MVEFELGAEKLAVKVRGWHKIWALKSRIEIPYAQILDVRANPAAAAGKRGLRVAGTHVPGFIVAGHFREGGKRVFWDVGNPRNAIVIDLEGGSFDRLVVEVADPADSVDRIREAIGRDR